MQGSRYGGQLATVGHCSPLHQERVRELDDALCDRIYHEEQSVVSEQEIAEKCDGLRAAVGEFAKYLFLAIPRIKHQHLALLASKYDSDLAAIGQRPMMITLMPRHIWEVTLGSAQKGLLQLAFGGVDFAEWEGIVGERLGEIQKGRVEPHKKKGWVPPFHPSPIRTDTVTRGSERR